MIHRRFTLRPVATSPLGRAVALALPLGAMSVPAPAVALPHALSGQDAESGKATPEAPATVAEKTRAKTLDEQQSDTLRRRYFNVDKSGLALQGWDPVSYLAEGGPKKGDAKHQSTFKGVTYRFASAANKKTFDADPGRYEPTYGGWCAWAILDDDLVEIDPRNHAVIDGRVYLFYKGFWGNAKNDWDKKVKKETAPKVVTSADRHWKTLVDKERARLEKKG